MHEISVVQNIIEIVATEAKRSGVDHVYEVHLEIGKLAGIEYDSLEFALENLTDGSVIETAKIIIDKPEGLACCNKCCNEFAIEDFTGSCNICNSFDIEIIKGRELRVKSITV